MKEVKLILRNYILIKLTLSCIFTSGGNKTGRKESDLGQIGVTMRLCTDGCIIGPPILIYNPIHLSFLILIYKYLFWILALSIKIICSYQ